MTEYQPTEQDRVLLDYAQTVNRIGPDAAKTLFRWRWKDDNLWADGYAQGINIVCERKPRTVTLSYQGKEWELPVPVGSVSLTGNATGVITQYGGKELAALWLAALREIANGEGGQ